MAGFRVTKIKRAGCVSQHRNEVRYVEKSNRVSAESDEQNVSRQGDFQAFEHRLGGVTEFQVACDPGVGLYATEIINILREKDKSLRLVCVIPHEEQATKWTPQLRERYFNMLAGCTELDCIDFHEQPDAQLLAYQRIIKQSGVVLAVYAPDLADGSAEDKAVSYALALGRPVMLIHPETLKTKWLNVPTEKAPG